MARYSGSQIRYNLVIWNQNTVYSRVGQVQNVRQFWNAWCKNTCSGVRTTVVDSKFRQRKNSVAGLPPGELSGKSH